MWSIPRKDELRKHHGEAIFLLKFLMVALFSKNNAPTRAFLSIFPNKAIVTFFRNT